MFGMITAVIAIATACSKDKDNAPPQPQTSPAVGYWTGSYTTAGVLGSTNYAMLIKPGGIARVYDLDTKTDTSMLAAAAKVDAVWTLNGMTLQTSYNSGTKTVNTSATLNAAYNNMSGTWAFEGVVKGNISLSK